MTISAFLKSADTASAPVHSMGRTRSKRLTSDRGHVIVIMWYEMWLIKGRQPLFRQTERYGLVALWLTDSFFFFLYSHASKVNWFQVHPVLVQPRNTGHLFHIYCWLQLLFIWAHHHAAVKLTGPQMAEFGTATGSTHHMSHYIISFVSPARWLYLDYFLMPLQHIGRKWSVLKCNRGTTQAFYCLLQWNITLYLIFHFKVNGAVNDSQFSAVDGGSSAATTLESPLGPLQSTVVNGSYFHPVIVLCSSHRGAGGWDRGSIFRPYDPAWATVLVPQLL